MKRPNDRTRLADRLRWISAALTGGLALLFLTLPATAQQNLFTPRVIVNNSAITNYEVQQRAALLRALGTPGNLAEQAVDQLIGDRLRLARATAQGITASEEEVAAGMEEFAARTDRTTDAFLAQLAGEGVARETFRDFVHAGIVWREVVRARFGARAQVSDAEIDRALALSSRGGAVRVLLSEVVLPGTPEFIDRALPIAEQIARIRSFDEFSAAAREVSIAPSREDGGRLDWLPLSNLPPIFAPTILALSPGEVTEPIPVPNAIVLFQLRAIEELDAAPPRDVAVEYAQFLLPADDPAAVARVRARVDTCDDLYGVARGLPEDRLRRETLPMEAVPRDIALEIARLDENEVSTSLVRGEARVFLMLCGRTLLEVESPSRNEVRQQLANRRLNAFADGYLEELRADAFIRFP